MDKDRTAICKIISKMLDNTETGEGDDGTGYAQCTNSKCGIEVFDDRDSAVEKWNRRAR